MSVDRYLTNHHFNPSAALLTGGIVAGMFAALTAIAPHVVPRVFDPPIHVVNIPVPPPPPMIEPTPPRAERRTTAPARPNEQVPMPTPQVPLPSQSEVSLDLGPAVPPIDAGTIGRDPVAEPPATPVAMLVDPAVDPRYAGLFQPPYPPEETRAEREGSVVIRVLIGSDGRVKRAERVSATSDAFWRVTERRALTAWRFKPGTRDGVPEERWRTMRVVFRLTE